MTTLITGGGSQIGVHLAKLLKQAGREAVFASRSGKRIPEGFNSVELDWYNEETLQKPFEAGPFEAVYLLGPPDVMDTSKSIIPFIDLAAKNRVKQFLYLSATAADEDDDESEPGRLPKYLKDIAQAAFEGIVNKENQVKRLVLLGPDTDTMSFDDITHRPVSAEEMIQFCLQFMNEEVARWYVESELGVEKGSEEK
ncbi:NmrA family protein [Coprinopsis sp. MPI-PUGE-AT-0042]|nr:NmrA family protein [Coprinopsis sp. MPI-PUGE-AT-0042]